MRGISSSNAADLLRRHLVATSRPFQLQVPGRPSFFSTATTRQNSASAAATTSSAPDRPLKASSGGRGSANVDWLQTPPRKVPPSDPAHTDAAFRQIVQDQTERNYAPAAPAPASAAADPKLAAAAMKLREMVKNDSPDAQMDSYRYLTSEIYPLVVNRNVDMPEGLASSVSILMRGIARSKWDFMRSPDLPTVGQIYKVLAEFGELRLEGWAMLVENLITTIVEMDPPRADGRSLSAVAVGRLSSELLMRDLVDSWKVLSSVKAAADQTDPDGFNFPVLDEALLERFSQSRNFIAAFMMLFPQHSPAEIGPRVAMLGVATYALMFDSQRSNASARRDATSFVGMITRLLRTMDYDANLVQEHTAKYLPGLTDYVVAQWPNVSNRLQALSWLTDPETQFVKDLPRTASGDIDIGKFQTLLEDAVKTKRRDHIDSLWKSFVGPDEAISGEKAAELRDYPELFDSFIRAWMSLNLAGRAAAGWKTIPRIGLYPTARTWNAMLTGCKEARNLNGIRNVWAKLMTSGMQLDTGLWTTLISGLIQSGDIEGGIQALKEMASLWTESLEKGTKTAVKPTIEPVNAAIVALVFQRRLDLAEDVLAWAGKRDIAPDIFTFNTLLGSLIRMKRDKETRRLFKLMQTQGVQADEKTFTIVLDAAFAAVPPDNQDEQVKALTSVLDGMKSVGLEPNMHTYGKVIFNLLGLGRKGVEVVDVMLNYLKAEGHTLSPYILTMLVDHYSNQVPPDLDSITALLAMWKPPIASMDIIFWERLIRGYLRVSSPSALDAAYEIYLAVSRSGVFLGLDTHIDLLNQLLREERIGDAQDLVWLAESEVEKRESRYGGKLEKVWGHRFWKLARQNNLLRPDNDAPAAAPGHQPDSVRDPRVVA
ncbi:hypothetical protein GGS23DRAFT_568152 [Durotheca rogersii]|uniref:uncharacterized protein n=1 Tax=Durotheca rogersii TaxID=419775 RepID=UPI0022202D0C|nr:uncharacterized protein GGS23DRAFT_568152 [Durotheca rogersii]KAI5863083.1 hypothetical protein GGS23DRAFT_568152 [Durotheca rogersii]